MTKAPRPRSTLPAPRSTRKHRRRSRATMDENSYMLPHGTRSAARPRVTTEPACTTAPTSVSTPSGRRPGWRGRLGGAGAATARTAAAAGHDAGAGGGGRRTGGRQRSPRDARRAPGGLLAGEGEHRQGVEQHGGERTAGRRWARSARLTRAPPGVLCRRLWGGRAEALGSAANSSRNTSGPLRDRPPTSTTVRPPLPSPPAGTARTQTRRRRTNSDRHRPSTMPTPASSATSLPGSWVTWKVAHSVVSTKVRLPPPGSSQVSPAASLTGVVPSPIGSAGAVLDRVDRLGAPESRPRSPR